MVLSVFISGIKNSININLIRICFKNENFKSAYKQCVRDNVKIFLISFGIITICDYLLHYLYSIYLIWLIGLLIKLIIHGYSLIYCVINNNKHCNRISNLTIETKNKLVSTSKTTYSTNILSLIDDLLVNLSFSIFIMIIHYIPFIGGLLSFVYSCWYSSYYFSTYRWKSFDFYFSVEDRTKYFETNWVYFLGLGLIINVLSYNTNILFSRMIHTILCPLFIIMTSGSKITDSKIQRLEILKGINYISEFLPYMFSIITNYFNLEMA
jgi:hypothetical protein